MRLVESWAGHAPGSLVAEMDAPTNAVAFSPKGGILAGTGTDGMIRLWNVTVPRTPKLVAAVKETTGRPTGTEVFSPDGKILAVVAEERQIPVVQLWNVSQSAHPVVLTQLKPVGAETSFYAVAFCPDGKTLASGGTYGTKAHGGGAVQIWNIADPARPAAVGQPLTEASAVSALAFSANGHALSSGNDYSRVWNVADPAHPVAGGQLPGGPTNAVNSVVISSGAHAALAIGGGDGTVWLWNVADPAHPGSLGHLTGESDGDGFSSVAFSPDRHTLAGGVYYHGTVWRWNLTDPAHSRFIGKVFTGSSNSVLSTAFRPDGHILAFADDSGSIRLWKPGVTSGS